MKNLINRQRAYFQISLILIGVAMIGMALLANQVNLINYYPGFQVSKIILLTVGSGMILTGSVFHLPLPRKWIQRFKLGGIAVNLMLMIVGLCIGLFLIEGGLRLLEGRWAGPTFYEAYGIHQTIADPKLGVRLAPGAKGHDAKGFRNASIPEQVDIVAIGDSQTYGISAARSDAWPQTLARLSDRRVYNMGLGYYGTVQYWVLIDEALEFSPEVIIVGFYFGNDLWGAYDLVYKNDHYMEFRDNDRLAELWPDTIGPQAQEFIDQNSNFEKQFWRQLPLSQAWDNWLVQDMAIGRLLYQQGALPEKIQQTTEHDMAKAWAQAFPDNGVVYDDGKVRTVLTTAYRLLALDLDEPRIAEGLRLSKKMLGLIQTDLESTDTKFMVLLIPTKEMVYAQGVEQQNGQLDPTHARLVEMETQARNEILDWCRQSKVECVDGLPVLVQAVARHEQIYPVDGGGHPIAHGYFLFAAAVNNALAKLNW